MAHDTITNNKYFIYLCSKFIVMAKEIERKFLVTGDFEPFVTRRTHIIQGYLCKDPDRTVRIRIRDNHGFITVKTRNHGCERNEWEYEIPVDDAHEMLTACPGCLEKTRCLIDAGDSLTWEVDIFAGANSGLVVAEIELPTADTPFERPSWLGEEVTGDKRYYNSNL